MDIAVVQPFDLRTALSAEAFWDRLDRHPAEAWRPAWGVALIIACIAWSMWMNHEGGPMTWVMGFLLVLGLYLVAAYPSRRLAVAIRLAMLHLPSTGMDERVHLNDHGCRYLVDGNLVYRADWRGLKRTVIGPDRLGIVFATVDEPPQDQYLYLRRRSFQHDDQWRELTSFLRTQPECTVIES